MSKNLLTIESFAEWCEKQPAEKRYEYLDASNCAFCQFLRWMGASNPNVGSDEYSLDNKTFRPLDHRINDAVQGDIGGLRTFGALAKRLRSLSA